MNFHSDQIFHVFNQGNNRQTIFFKDEHFEFFLWKMRAYVLPFGDFISYCLMPTHFHWQVYVRDTVIERKIFRNHVNDIEFKRRLLKYGANAKPIRASTITKANETPTISLNDSIGILQMAYTKAINQEKDWSGSLFRSDCKAKDGWIDEFITLTKSNSKPDPRFTGCSDNAFTCFSQRDHYVSIYS